MLSRLCPHPDGPGAGAAGRRGTRPGPGRSSRCMAETAEEAHELDLVGSVASFGSGSGSEDRPAQRHSIYWMSASTEEILNGRNHCSGHYRS
jgi:hypothetical protein